MTHGKEICRSWPSNQVSLVPSALDLKGQITPTGTEGLQTCCNGQDIGGPAASNNAGGGVEDEPGEEDSRSLLPLVCLQLNMSLSLLPVASKFRFLQTFVLIFHPLGNRDQDFGHNFCLLPVLSITSFEPIDAPLMQTPL